RHTRSKRDWSSDVCSSDLCPPLLEIYSFSKPLKNKFSNTATIVPATIPLLVIQEIQAGNCAKASGFTVTPTPITIAAPTIKLLFPDKSTEPITLIPYAKHTLTQKIIH